MILARQNKQIIMWTLSTTIHYLCRYTSHVLAVIVIVLQFANTEPAVEIKMDLAVMGPAE